MERVHQVTGPDNLPRVYASWRDRHAKTAPAGRVVGGRRACAGQLTSDGSRRWSEDWFDRDEEFVPVVVPAVGSDVELLLYALSLTAVPCFFTQVKRHGTALRLLPPPGRRPCRRRFR